MLKGYRLVLRGSVQGVFYRAFICDHASRLGISGWVRNDFDGKVTIEAHGKEESLDKFITVSIEGPAAASVDGHDLSEIPFDEGVSSFDVRYS